MSGAAATGRASLLTPPGRGAVAVIAAEGAAAFDVLDAHFHAANGSPLRTQEIDRIAFGHWSDAAPRTNGGLREEVIVCRTGAEELEIHCHGGVAAAGRILAALTSGGCSIEAWVDWVCRRTAPQWQVEAEAALAAVLTRRTAAILLDQRQGALHREIMEVAAQLRSNPATSATGAIRRLDALLELAPLGQRLTRPWQVAIAGRPNVGKSSLINALVGYERAIVFDEPGTTRDVLAADTAIDGWPVRLSDGAGLRATADPLEAAGVELAARQLRRADLVIWVLDATALTAANMAAPGAVAGRDMEAALGEAPQCEPLVIVNKIDLVSMAPSPACLGVSALTGAGVEELLAAIARRIVPKPPAAGAAVPFLERHVEVLSGARELVDRGEFTRAAELLETSV
jgi:tRNA modification GTPase